MLLYLTLQSLLSLFIFFFQAEDGIRDFHVTGVQTCALPISKASGSAPPASSGPSRARWPSSGPSSAAAPRSSQPPLTSTRRRQGRCSGSTWPPSGGRRGRTSTPASAYGTRKKVEKRILPAFGDVPLGELDASTIGAWKAAMVADQLSPQTVNTYLSLLGTILNAAVDDDYL